MEVKYIKDLRSNYMVIYQEVELQEEAYCIKMLRAKGLDGVLKVEERSVDNLRSFYYDITAKQTISNILEKGALDYERMKKLLQRIMETIEKAYDYLLNENSFLLSPDMIYMDLTTEEVYLCYLPGYEAMIKNGMCSLIEYLMNKVDYNDKEAVFLIYNLYAVSKEESLTFEHLMKAINGDEREKERRNEGEKGRGKDRGNAEEKERGRERDKEGGKGRVKERDSEEGIGRQKECGYETAEKKKLVGKKGSIVTNGIELKYSPDSISGPSLPGPIMMEKINSEVEALCYPWTTYAYTGLCGLIMVIIIMFNIKSKLIYTPLGNRVDLVKLLALILILTVISGYLLPKIWDKRRKIARIVPMQEYIDPRPQKGMEQGIQEVYMEKPRRAIADQKEEGLEPTTLLNMTIPEGVCLLIPLEDSRYEAISLDSFPFFIGKLKKNIDYCLEKDSVSRYHAKISMEGEQYYITDLNSTNGTFINKEALPMYQPMLLQHGDEVAFSNIKYQFIISE